jgi:hypothetical protein
LGGAPKAPTRWEACLPPTTALEPLSIARLAVTGVRTGGTVHDRDQAGGPVDPGLVGSEDARGAKARLVLLRQEHLVPGGTQAQRSPPHSRCALAS